MRHAIIDVGSNTIRTVIHNIDQENHTVIHNASIFAEIIKYTENNRLNPEGISKLSDSLCEMARICSEFECGSIHCFATASLRNIANSAEVLEHIRNASGIDIMIISGEDEILYDLAGLMSAENITDGIGLDLGGGSCQIFTFSGRTLQSSVSLPIGSLKMYDKFAYLGDNKKIQRAISEYAGGLLSEYKAFRNTGFDKIYAIGGTARVASKVHSELIRTEYDSVVSKENLSVLLSDERVYDILAKICPERKNSFFAGCAVLHTICCYTGASCISAVQAGVREGFLYSVLLRKH